MGNWLRAERLSPLSTVPWSSLSLPPGVAAGLWTRRARPWVGRRSWLQACSLPHLRSLESILESQQVAVTLTLFFSGRITATGHLHSLWVLVKDRFPNFRQKEPPRALWLTIPSTCFPTHFSSRFVQMYLAFYLNHLTYFFTFMDLFRKKINIFSVNRK